MTSLRAPRAVPGAELHQPSVILHLHRFRPAASESFPWEVEKLGAGGVTYRVGDSQLRDAFVFPRSGREKDKKRCVFSAPAQPSGCGTAAVAPMPSQARRCRWRGGTSGAAGAESAFPVALGPPRSGAPARQAQCKCEINRQNKGKYIKPGHVPCGVTGRCAFCDGRINGPENEGLCSAAGCFPAGLG